MRKLLESRVKMKHLFANILCVSITGRTSTVRSPYLLVRSRPPLPSTSTINLNVSLAISFPGCHGNVGILPPVLAEGCGVEMEDIGLLLALPPAALHST